MGDAWDVVESVSDAAEAAKDAKRRKPIGFWRTMVAIGGVFWTVMGIIPGIPAMISIDRWMKGKSRRPTVAMAMGLVTAGFLAGMLVVARGWSRPSATRRCDSPAGQVVFRRLRAVVGLVAASLLGWWVFFGKYPASPAPTPPHRATREPRAARTIAPPPGRPGPMNGC